MKIVKIILITLLSIILSGVSYANYLDDWPDDAICNWMEQSSPPQHILDEAIKRGLECVPKSLIKASKNKSKIKIYDVAFSQSVLDSILSKDIGKTDFDFSIYKITNSHEKLQCFFRIRRVVYENIPEGEIEDWNIAEGYLEIDSGKVSIDINRSRWKMKGLSADQSYLENEVNLMLTEDGFLVGKMAYFSHHIDTGEVPRIPLYIELKKHKRSTPINIHNIENMTAKLYIDVEDWAGGVIYIRNCKEL